jgi:hypothetical protein
VSMKAHAAAMNPMLQPGSGRHVSLRPLLNDHSCQFFAPSGHTQIPLVQVKSAGPVSVESEGQSSQGMAEKHVGVSEGSEGIRVSRMAPIVDASTLGNSAKKCSLCGYSKPLVDFEDTVSSADKRTEVCRACLAVVKAKRGGGRKLYHLELTPEEAWERAKICNKCGVTKEIRDFGRSERSKDGLKTWCRSCTSNYNKALPPNLPVDSPQRCNRCNKVKAATEYHRRPTSPNGLCHICKPCNMEYLKERRMQWKASNVHIQRHEKLCTKCGKVKLTSEFQKKSASIDGLHACCKLCCIEEKRASRASVDMEPPPAPK